MTVEANIPFRFSAILALLLVPAIIGPLQAADDRDAELFGDIFAHPRDRHYLPGTAPSRAEFDSSLDYNDDRGEVSRWEYRKGRRIISREVWADENGEPKARLGIGRKF